MNKLADNQEENEKKRVFPRLRFQEFRKAEGWDVRQLWQIAQKKASAITLNSLENNFGNYAVYGASGLLGKIAQYTFDHEYIGIVKDGSGVGRVMLCPPMSSIIGTLDSIKASENNATKFIYYWLTHISLNSYVIGGAIPHIYFKDYSKMNLGKPSLFEQQKIANCLSSIDDLIETEAKKFEELKKHKTCLMQKLFPAEGEVVPQFRFPEFQEELNWKIVQLGNISKIVRGGSPRPIDDYLTTGENTLNWLKIGDVDKEAKYITGTIEKVRKSALKKTREVQIGDLIMSNSMSFGRPYIMKIKACIHDGWIAITQISNTVTINYLYYFILSNASQIYFLKAAAGSSVKNLNADIIKLLNVDLPQLHEQQKIADCLSSLDDLITAQTKKIETLKTHKKGLMQQLFPVMNDEVKNE